MNRDQWHGGLKQLKGALKKRWGRRWTGDTVLQTMGELERLLGVFQRQYGHLKARERRDQRWNGSHETPHGAMDRPYQRQTSLVLIQGRNRSRHASRQTTASPPLERI
jgi:uncharacterized protein YjbJ (UPF0337 family)